MEFFQQYHIAIIGSLFLCVVIGMTWLTYKEKKWIRNTYKKEDIIALGFGVTCYGLSSDQGPPKRYKGFLLIHRAGLLFKNRFSNTRFDVPGESIQKAYHDTSHMGSRLYKSAVKIDFSTSRKRMDTIAFKLAYPPQWIEIIEKAFIKNLI
ncbi:MAG: hypothetical protein JRI38_02875 [Deltaproteobacteria bacterium]|nr:hypothetical protein [Deltaproteobacteria bacterium]